MKNKIDLAQEMYCLLNKKDNTKELIISEALDNLSKAAGLLDETDQAKYSEILTKIIEKIAS